MLATSHSNLLEIFLLNVLTSTIFSQSPLYAKLFTDKQTIFIKSCKIYLKLFLENWHTSKFNKFMHEICIKKNTFFVIKNPKKNPLKHVIDVKVLNDYIDQGLLD